MDYFVTYNHSGVQFNLAQRRKNNHCAVKCRLRYISRLLPWQTVIKSILLNQGAPAQISLLFGAQGSRGTEGVRCTCCSEFKCSHLDFKLPEWLL